MSKWRISNWDNTIRNDGAGMDCRVTWQQKGSPGKNPFLKMLNSSRKPDYQLKAETIQHRRPWSVWLLSLFLHTNHTFFVCLTLPEIYLRIAGLSLNYEYQIPLCLKPHDFVIHSVKIPCEHTGLNWVSLIRFRCYLPRC